MFRVATDSITLIGQSFTTLPPDKPYKYPGVRATKSGDLSAEKEYAFAAPTSAASTRGVRSIDCIDWIRTERINSLMCNFKSHTPGFESFRVEFVSCPRNHGRVHLKPLHGEEVGTAFGQPPVEPTQSSVQCSRCHHFIAGQSRPALLDP